MSNQRIASEGARWVMSELQYLSGKQATTYLTVIGGMMGISPADYHQAIATDVQVYAGLLDGAVDLLAKGCSPKSLARGQLLTVLAKTSLGVCQASPSKRTVFLAACGALAIDAALALACPPVGIGMVFCGLSLMVDAVGFGAAAYGLEPGTLLGSDAGKALALQTIFRARCRAMLPQKRFYNWKFDARDPGMWFPI